MSTQQIYRQMRQRLRFACNSTRPLLLIMLAMPASSDDSAYHSVRDSVFWRSLYNESYIGLYCGREFSAGDEITVEHVYPAGWIAKANGCQNRTSCPTDAYRQASSDLHNLWPAQKRYNSSRGNKPFGAVLGDTPRFPDETPTCDFERTSGANAVVEPRDSVKGEIARSMLYMIRKYQLPDHGQFDLMQEWNFRDPPDDTEMMRYIKAKTLQGRANPYIDMWVR